MWTSILKRILNISKAQAHSALDTIEDPVQMMQLAITELEASIVKLSKAVAVAMANQKKLQKDHEQFKLEAISWYQRAALAMQNGNEDLAKKALTQKTLAEKKEIEYRLLAENSQKMVEQLNAQLDEFKLKLEETTTKQKIYAARAETAKTQKQIAESLGGLNASALANLEKYEDKINQMAAEAESISAMSSAKNNLNQAFREIETELNVQSDFEQLKAHLEQKSMTEKPLDLETIEIKFKEMQSKTPQIEQKSDLNKLLNEFFKQ